MTTYDAGMAVHDWPTTYGYNLFLYPWQTWLSGPWDLLIEHGHRLLGALAGLLTITLTVVIWWQDQRRWMRWLALIALALVVGQGVLGGMRVVQNSTRLAMLHGCVGPVFFALCVALAAMTSRWWNTIHARHRHAGAGRLHHVAVFTAVLAYVQLIVGAQLRHMPVDASWTTFQSTIMAHLFMAGVLVLFVFLLVTRIFLQHRSQRRLCLPAAALALLVFVQLLLGGGAWVVKYSWPSWMAGVEWTQSYTIHADGLLQAITVTAHVANGSLILATALLLALRSLRLVRAAAATVYAGTSLQEVVG